MRAPIFSSACRWRLIGRAPIAQPPGSETLARPSRASSGPRTSTDARMVLTSSYGASTDVSVRRPGLDDAAHLERDLGAQVGEQSGQRAYVAHLGHVAQAHGLVGEQRRAQVG